MGGHKMNPEITQRIQSVHVQPSDAHWDHEPSPASHRFKAFMDQRKAIPGRFESLGTLPRFMESSVFLSDLLTGHEPEMLKLLEINKRIFRFM